MTSRIEREIQIDAPLERVWTVLTEPRHVASWFGNRAQIDPRPGGEARFTFEGHGEVQATVERIEPQTFFSYRWAFRTDEAPVPGNSTLVEFTLAPDGGGTRLTVVETGFDTLAVSPAEQNQSFQDNTSGWRSELDELRVYAEQLAA